MRLFGLPSRIKRRKTLPACLTSPAPYSSEMWATTTAAASPIKSPTYPLAPATPSAPAHNADTAPNKKPIIEDNKDDLIAALAQIKELEEWEAYKDSQERFDWPLQATWEKDTFDPPPDIGGSGNYEDDLAMARRLASEWEQQGQDLAMAISLAQEWGHDGEEVATAKKLSMEWEQQAAALGTNTLAGLGIRPDGKFKGKNDDDNLDDADDTSPDLLLLEHRPLFVAMRPCSRCARPVPSPRETVSLAKVAQTYPPSLLRALHAPCRSCRANHCRGCFKPIPCPPTCTGQSDRRFHASCSVLNCCSEVRAIALFEVLSAFDLELMKEKRVSQERVNGLTKSRRWSSTSASVGPGGTGYGTDQIARSATIPTYQTTAKLALDFDQLLTRTLSLLTSLLPSPEAPGCALHDLLPHPSILPLLALSQLPILLGTLLRNDNLGDWLERSNVYRAMLDLLRKMAETELGMGVLVRTLPERKAKSRDVSLGQWMWEDKSIKWEEGQATGGKPLVVHFRKLTRQCETFLKGIERMAADKHTDADLTTAKQLCVTILAASEDVEHGMDVLRRVFHQGSSPTAENTHGSSSKGKGKDPAAIAAAYTESHNRHSFAHVNMHPYNSYHFAGAVQSSQGGTRRPADRLRMVKELGVMSTSLPEGIWVRVDEVRFDVLKIMIAGPVGTPYAFGLFEFDCFLPLQYPNAPPQMHLRTTGGGAVRFNPNLYNCGKVCLSLLGTWPGSPEEQWNASRSTLLQVLVSVQSMILVDAPYFNEPGYGKADLRSPQSIAYNQNIRRQTLKWAINTYMTNNQRDGMWGDVIAAHFLIRREEIKAQIKLWVKDDPTLKTLEGEFEQGLTTIQSWGKDVRV